jgi:hypothetical protein
VPRRAGDPWRHRLAAALFRHQRGDGDSEIVPTITDIPDVLEVLKDLGYFAEGEHGIEVSPAGQISRMTIKYRPRESLLAKLINRCTLNANVSVNPKDFLGP